MKIKEIYLHGFLYAIFSVIFLTLKATPIDAQGQSLSIYPPVIEIQTTPPSSPVIPITIQNNNTENVILELQLIPFKTNNNTGQIMLVPEQLSKGFYPYYANKIQFLIDDKKTTTVELLALERRDILLNVNLEKGDPPGDYYFSIIAISKGEGNKESSTSQIPTGIGTNLLLSVGPKTPATGGISEFTTNSFLSKGPVEFKLKLHNASSHLLAPTGTIVITNLFGKNVDTLKLLPQYVLAGSDRYLVDDTAASPTAELTSNLLSNTPKAVWDEKFLLGWYKATATILLEENGRSVTSSIYFLAFPTYLFFGIVILLFILISIYIRVKKKI